MHACMCVWERERSYTHTHTKTYTCIHTRMSRTSVTQVPTTCVCVCVWWRERDMRESERERERERVSPPWPKGPLSRIQEATFQKSPLFRHSTLIYICIFMCVYVSKISLSRLYTLHIYVYIVFTRFRNRLSSVIPPPTYICICMRFRNSLSSVVPPHTYICIFMCIFDWTPPPLHTPHTYTQCLCVSEAAPLLPFDPT